MENNVLHAIIGSFALCISIANAIAYVKNYYLFANKLGMRALLHVTALGCGMIAAMCAMLILL